MLTIMQPTRWKTDVEKIRIWHSWILAGCLVFVRINVSLQIISVTSRLENKRYGISEIAEGRLIAIPRPFAP